MKFVCTLVLTDTLEKITIVPPCRGYYTNLSIQNSSAIIGGTSVSETEKMDHMFLGVNVSEFVLNDIADASGEGTGTGPYAPRIRGDITHDHDFIYQKFIHPGDDLESSAAFLAQQKHWGKKRLRIKTDTDLLTLLYKSDDVTPSGYLLIQGNFIPAKGALFKQTAKIGGLGADGDWTHQNRFLIGTKLANAQVKVTMFVTYSATAYQAIAYFRLRRHGDVEFTDTVSAPRGDILDGDFIDQDNISSQGIIGSLPFQTVADQIGQKFETVLDLGNVNDGDQLSWDTTIISGTEAGGNEVTITLAGIVPTQEWCEEADFLHHDRVYDMNRDVNGVYFAL